MDNAILILHGGLLSTVQDGGRFGYMQYGIPPAGAMDKFSMNIANLLVGNDANAAVIETCYLGPHLLFQCDETISITGAQANVTINDQPVSMWHSLQVQKGDVLKMEPVSAGLYNYIAFSRGLDVPLVMGSKSTYLPSKLGGLHGRKLQADDVISLGEIKKEVPQRMLRKERIPVFSKERTLRVVLGPQDNHFTGIGIDTFFNSVYTITSASDRMGYRLDGPPLEHKKGADIISDGTSHGSIQVPGNGLPIILLSDRGTTGGYTKIATVIAKDICALAQMPPGSRVRFQAISAQDANARYRSFFGQLEDQLITICEPEFSAKNEKVFHVQVDGRSFHVTLRQQSKK
jgi:antagonist of KipI